MSLRLLIAAVEIAVATVQRVGSIDVSKIPNWADRSRASRLGAVLHIGSFFDVYGSATGWHQKGAFQ